MSRRVAVVVFVVLLAAGGAAFVVTYLQNMRLNANLVASRNNLRDLALFAAHHANPDPTRDAARLPREIPAATILLPGVAPDDRLSWAVRLLPSLDQKRHPVEQLVARIDPAKPWPDPRNQDAARARLAVFLCPENPPQVPAGAAAVTCYVAVAGLGADAATLALPDHGPTPPRAGAWRYDAITPFDRIADGLSQTLLLGETADEPGPWLRGGRATCRGFDDGTGAKPPVGAGGQFGGYFPNVANFALCDGSVRPFTPGTTPGVLFRMATVADGGQEPIVGE